MPSVQFNRMTSQISQLCKTLLPRNLKKDILELTPRLSLRALSFRVLSHAEFENYFEDRVVEIAMAANDAWLSRRHISHSTFCLLAFSGQTMEKVPETLQPPPKKKQSDWLSLVRPDRRLSSSISSYIYSVRSKNNGIKEENILRMLLPIGFDPVDLDELLVTELNDFGTKRGEAAHKSVAGHITTGINPKDEYLQVKRIVGGIKEIDRKLSAILKVAR